MPDYTIVYFKADTASEGRTTTAEIAAGQASPHLPRRLVCDIHALAQRQDAGGIFDEDGTPWCWFRMEEE